MPTLAKRVECEELFRFPFRGVRVFEPQLRFDRVLHRVHANRMEQPTLTLDPGSPLTVQETTSSDFDRDPRLRERGGEGLGAHEDIRAVKCGAGSFEVDVRFGRQTQVVASWFASDGRTIRFRNWAERSPQTADQGLQYGVPCIGNGVVPNCAGQLVTADRLRAMQHEVCPESTTLAGRECGLRYDLIASRQGEAAADVDAKRTGSILHRASIMQVVCKDAAVR